MAYLLDADVFLRAKNLHYGLDFCPAFWNWLVVNNVAEMVFSVEKVGDEVGPWRMNYLNGPKPAAPVSFSAQTPRFFPRWLRSARGQEINSMSLRQ